MLKSYKFIRRICVGITNILLSLSLSFNRTDEIDAAYEYVYSDDDDIQDYPLHHPPPAPPGPTAQSPGQRTRGVRPGLTRPHPTHPDYEYVYYYDYDDYYQV